MASSSSPPPPPPPPPPSPPGFWGSATGAFRTIGESKPTIDAVATAVNANSPKLATALDSVPSFAQAATSIASTFVAGVVLWAGATAASKVYDYYYARVDSTKQRVLRTLKAPFAPKLTPISDYLAKCEPQGAGELRAAIDRLLTPELPAECLVIDGPSNIGKTFLVLKVLAGYDASLQPERHTPGVIYIPCRKSNPGSAFDLWYGALGGITNNADVDTTIESAMRSFRKKYGRRPIVVVDDVHRMMNKADGPDLLMGFIAKCCDDGLFHLILMGSQPVTPSLQAGNKVGGMARVTSSPSVVLDPIPSAQVINAMQQHVRPKWTAALASARHGVAAALTDEQKAALQQDCDDAVRDLLTVGQELSYIAAVCAKQSSAHAFRAMRKCITEDSRGLPDADPVSTQFLTNLLQNGVVRMNAEDTCPPSLSGFLRRWQNAYSFSKTTVRAAAAEKYVGAALITRANLHAEAMAAFDALARHP